MAKEKPAKKGGSYGPTLFIQGPPAGYSTPAAGGLNVSVQTNPYNLSVTATLYNSLGNRVQVQTTNSSAGTGIANFQFNNLSQGTGYSVEACLSNTPAVCDTHDQITLT